MNLNLSQIPHQARKVITVLVTIGLLGVLGFTFSNLFSPHTQQPSNTSKLQKPTPEERLLKPTSAPIQSDPTEWKLYKNQYDGYEIKYPPNWFLYPASDQGNGTDITDSDISRYEDVPASDDRNHVRVNIIAFSNRQNLELNDWLQGFDQEQVHSETPIELAGIRGVKRIETNSEFLQMEPIERATTIYLPWQSVVFRITVFPENSVHKNTVKTMLQTFRPANR